MRMELCKRHLIEVITGVEKLCAMLKRALDIPVKSQPPSPPPQRFNRGVIQKLILNVMVEDIAGVTIPELKEKTGLRSRQIENLLYRLRKEGHIKTTSHGVNILTQLGLDMAEFVLRDKKND